MFGGVHITGLSTHTILMVSGEASGDLHGGNLAKEIFQQCPQVKILGMGGAQMQKAGVHLLENIEGMSVVGISEVFSHFTIIKDAFKRLRQFLEEHPPDLIICIDYPEFNLRLAKIAKRKKIKILYYISPQIWAWRRWRIKTIAQNVDTMLVVFPFELPFYQNAGIDVHFVGHPLVDIVKPKLTREEGLKKFHLDPSKPIISLLPGSRRGEIRHILPSLLEAAQKIAQKEPDRQFLLAQAPTISDQEIQPFLEKIHLKIHCYEGYTYDIISLSDLVIVASGTATLETALLNTPMILVYRLSALSYLLGRLLVQVPFIGLVNLVAEKKIVPELIQQHADPENIAFWAEKLLQNPKTRKTMRQELKMVKEKLGKIESSKQAAQIALQMLEKAT